MPVFALPTESEAAGWLEVACVLSAGLLAAAELAELLDAVSLVLHPVHRSTNVIRIADEVTQVLFIFKCAVFFLELKFTVETAFADQVLDSVFVPVEYGESLERQPLERLRLSRYPQAVRVRRSRDHPQLRQVQRRRLA